MPAWGPTHGDEQLWDLVAMVKRLPALTPDEYGKLAEAPADDGHHHDHGTRLHATDVHGAEDSGSTEIGEHRHTHGDSEGHAH